MEKILNILKQEENSFNNTSMLIQKKEIIEMTSQFVKDYNIQSREFLALWMIYKFPHEIFGENIDKQLYDTIVLLFEQKDVSLLASITLLFRQWKEKDNMKLRNELFYKYHNMGVSLFNLEKSETTDEIEASKTCLRNCRKSVLENAHKIGGAEFVNKITNYKPIVYNLYDLEKISEKAFWDMVAEKFNHKNYDWIYVILEHVQTLFKNICPSRTEEFNEIIDIPFIKQQVEHDAYTDMQNLTFKLLEIVEDLQAAIHDQETKKLREQEFNLVNLLHEIVSRSENILQFILQFKKN